jgi:hypothetical protein
MLGNNCQRRAMREQQDQYKLSDDIAQTVLPKRDASEGWPPTLWAQLTCKYLHDSRRRATLGALGIMAGYDVCERGCAENQ